MAALHIKFNVIILSTLFTFILQIKDISISKLSNNYSPKQLIDFFITNNEKKDVFFGIAIEAKFSDGWKEVVNDITNVKNVTSLIYHLPKKANKHFIFNLKEIDTSPFEKKPIELRLKVHYSNKVGGKESIIFSSLFKLQ